jgi:hypothetical protein
MVVLGPGPRRRALSPAGAVGADAQAGMSRPAAPPAAYRSWLLATIRTPIHVRNRCLMSPTVRSALSVAALTLAAPPAFAAAPPIPTATVTVMPTVAQNPVIDGRDGTYSAAINGFSYWAFNDTAMKQANASGQNFFSNSLSWSTSLSAANGIDLNMDQVDSSGLPAQFIPFTAREAAFIAAHAGSPCQQKPCGESLAIWPGPIVYNPANRQVIIPFGLIARGGPISGFVSEGGGLAVGTVLPNGDFAMTRPTQSAGIDPALMWSKNDQQFSDQAFILNGYYYAYGGKNVFVTTEDLLARVPIAQVLQRTAWTYYAGNEVWSPDVNTAVPLFDGSASGSSVFFDSYLDEWVAIFSNNFANTLSYAVASAPEGPWSASTLLYTGLTGYQNNADYAARAHPEFSPDGGMTEYVSYVHDTGFLQQDLPLIKVVFSK